MAPNMISAIKRARKDSTQTEQLNARDSLLYLPNTYLVQSLALAQKKITKSRKNITDGTRKSHSPMNDPHVLYEEETQDGSSLSGDASTIFTQPARNGNARRKTVAPKPSNSNPNSKKKEKDQKRGHQTKKNESQNPTTPLDPPLALAVTSSSSGYSTLAMLDLIADVYSKVWEYYLKDLYNPLVDILKDIFAHNRLSRNLVDPKMRSVFEFFTTIVPATAYNVRKYNPPTGDAVSPPNSRPPSRSSTPRKDGILPPAVSRPSTSGGIGIGVGLGVGGGGIPSPGLGHHPPKKQLLHNIPPPLADYPAANTHFFLFGRMLGILPTLQNQIRPSLVYVVTMTLVMAVCEKCLKYHQLVYDDEGIGVLKPSPAEFNLRLTLTASSARQALIAPKIATIPIRKALLILKCLISTIQEHHFTLRSLQPACVEYDSDLPWNEHSISAIIHLFLTPIYSTTSEVKITEQPISFGPSLLPKLYASMREEAIARAEEAANLLPPETPSSPAAPPPGSRPSTAKGLPSSNPVRPVNKILIKPTINGIPLPDHKEAMPDQYPPVHFLAAVIGRLWKEKDSLPLISFDTALKILSTRPSPSLTISLSYFLCIVCEGWSMECETILNKIKIKKYSNSRRHGLKPLSTPFTKSSSALTVADKKTLHFIYNKYADKNISSFENLNKLPLEISDANSVSSGHSGEGSEKEKNIKNSSSTGVDWDFVREECIANGTIVPYWNSRPDFLTEKSNAELEHLTKVVILTIRKREEWQKLISESGWHEEWLWGGVKISSSNRQKGGEGSSSPGSISVSSQDKRLSISRVISPAPIQDYQHRLIARMNTNTSSDIFEMEMKALGKKTGQMSSVWEVSQATSRTISEDSSDHSFTLNTSTNQEDDIFLMDETDLGSIGQNNNSKILARATSAKEFRRPSSFGDLISNGKYFPQLSLPSSPSFSLSQSPIMSPTSRIEPPEDSPISVRPKSGLERSKVKQLETLYAITPSPTSLGLTLTKHSSTPTLNPISSLTSPKLSTIWTSSLHSKSSTGIALRSATPKIFVTDILNPKIGSEILTRAGLLPPPLPTMTKSENPIAEISSSNEATSEDGEDGNNEERNIIQPLYSPYFQTNPHDLRRRLLSPPIGHDRSGLDQDQAEVDDEECLIFRTMAPEGVQNRRTVDLGHYGNIRESEIPVCSASEDIHSLILTDVGLSSEDLADVLLKFTPTGSSLSTLRKLDLSGNRIGKKGCTILADTLADNCSSITDICLKGIGITDESLLELLIALCDGGGQHSLLRLDLSSNELTFTSADIFKKFSMFTKLKFLDLSWNTITLQFPTQKKNLKEILSLPKLEVFSLSYNRILDSGFVFCLESIPITSRLKVLDLAHVFATEKSSKVLLQFIQRPTLVIELLMLQGIVLSIALNNKILSVASEITRKDGSRTHVFLDGHHTGITIPLKYSSETNTAL